MNETILAVIIEWSNEVCEQIKLKWSNMSAIDGEAEINVTPETLTGMIIANFEATGMKAWISEYGSGHLLDKDNPYLAAYMASDMYNWIRATEDNEFLGRAAGATIYRPDGTTDVSTGKAEGFRLEHGFNGHPGYKAQNPGHVIKESIEVHLPELRDKLVVALGEYITQQLTISIQIKL